MKKNKNVSKKIKNGTTIQTRDEYLKGGYKKQGYENKGRYRRAVVIDSNNEDELALVTLTTSKKGHPLKDYKKGKSRFRPFVKTKDNDNKAIKLGYKFKANNQKQNVSKEDVNIIKREALLNSSNALRKTNKRKLRKLKGRK